MRKMLSVLLMLILVVGLVAPAPALAASPKDVLCKGGSYVMGILNPVFSLAGDAGRGAGSLVENSGDYVKRVAYRVVDFGHDVTAAILMQDSVGGGKTGGSDG